MDGEEKHFGEVVIYSDPITRTKAEGAARLISKIGTRKIEQGILEEWNVQFWCDELKDWEKMTYVRKVLIDNDDETIYEQLPEGKDIDFLQAKYCKCCICGNVARTTPARDYFLVNNDPLRRLKCESCLMRSIPIDKQ